MIFFNFYVKGYTTPPLIIQILPLLEASKQE